ncbi:MAG TPA: phytoene/squalene synthase family protein [bacterium]|nr:phytoene/squalene synthase family protein [bacterium]
MDPRKGSLEKKTSFYYPLLLLPPARRRALESLYRFCWAADEISDGPGTPVQKRRKLALFKRELTLAFQQRARDPLFRDFQGVVKDFHLSPEPLRRILAGVERDLKPLRFKRFQELKDYALQVAGGPGLAIMEVFGLRDAAHRAYAENLGIFLQLTNITRDFLEDRDLGRFYLPAEDFKRFHLDPSNIEEGNSHWKPFVEFQLDRAWTFLERSRKALTLRQRGDRAFSEAIASVYIRLYQKLRNDPDRILRGRTRLSKREKASSVLGAVLRCAWWKVAG